MSEKDQNRTTDETAASLETAPAPKKRQLNGLSFWQL